MAVKDFEPAVFWVNYQEQSRIQTITRYIIHKALRHLLQRTYQKISERSGPYEHRL